MIALKSSEIEEQKIESIPYKGKPQKAVNVGIRWLSKGDIDDTGAAGYGLRLFTIGPDGDIPIHSHFYVQTMYIVSGRFECFGFDPETDQVTQTSVVGPGDAVFVPSNEPHGMRNLSSTEEATFLCCICNVYEKGSDKSA